MRGILVLFTPRDRVKLAGLVCLIVLNGMLEVFGIGLLLPYVALLQEPSRIAENRYVGALDRWVGLQSAHAFLIAISAGLLVLFVMKGVFGIWVQSTQVRFVYARQSEFGQRLLKGYLERPYEFFLAVNTSNLIGNLTTSLNQFCGGVIQSLLTLLSELVVIAGLLAFLLFFSPLISIVAIVFISLFSFGFIRAVRARISRYAAENDVRWKAALRVINESVVAAKDVQIFGRAAFFVNAYGREMSAFAVAASRYNVLVLLPRTMMETIAATGMILLVIFAILTGHDTKDMFALLAVFAVATIRIVPSANRIVQAWHAISFQRPAVDVVRSGLVAAAAQHEAPEDPVHDRPLREGITIRIKEFAYPTNPLFRLRDIDVEIGQGQTVAFIGHSGSGKTTLIDLLLGFYPNFKGEITVDGKDIRAAMLAWRRRVGYIPQTIFLLDDTIARNIAFGLPEQAIAMSRVRQAVALAGLEKVVSAQADGLNTVVGDRGIRLSGGERQRIGIARALYNDPDLVVMDEATSALDNEIERQIVGSILGLSPAKTVIVIAHRLTTVRYCDVVFLMSGGRIVDRGPFDEIAQRHPDFVAAQALPAASAA